MEHDVAWRPNRDISWNWDESYTMPENLYLVYGMGAGLRYRKLARQYLNDSTSSFRWRTERMRWRISMLIAM